jgi:hypothetical protein
MLISSLRAARAFVPRQAFGSQLRGLHHKIVLVGGGTGSVTVASQLQRAFAVEGRALGPGDLAIIEPAKTHYCEFLEHVKWVGDTIEANTAFETFFQTSQDGLWSGQVWPRLRRWSVR